MVCRLGNENFRLFWVSTHPGVLFPSVNRRRTRVGQVRRHRCSTDNSCVLQSICAIHFQAMFYTALGCDGPFLVSIIEPLPEIGHGAIGGDAGDPIGGIDVAAATGRCGQVCPLCQESLQRVLQRSARLAGLSNSAHTNGDLLR